jgi:hypothetical protein
LVAGPCRRSRSRFIVCWALQRPLPLNVCAKLSLPISIVHKDLTCVQQRRSVLRDEVIDLHDDASGCEGRDHSGDTASMDQGPEDQTSQADSRRCESEANLDPGGFGPATRDKRENLLEGPRTTEEIALNQAGRAGADNTDTPLTE